MCYGVRLRLARVGLPGTVTVSLRATDVNGKATGADLASQTFDGNALIVVPPTTNSELKEVIWAAPTALATNTLYAIVVRATGGDASNRVEWHFDASGDAAYADGDMWHSTNSGSTWTSPDPGDAYFEVFGSLNHIAHIEEHSARFGGTLTSPRMPYALSVIVRLRDPTKELITLTWVGYRLDIGWGYVDASSVNRYSEGAPLYVVEAQTVSTEGRIDLELHCISLWDYLRMVWLNQSTALRARWVPGTADEANMKEVIHELLGGSTLGTTDNPNDGAVVQFDASGPTYTSQSVTSRTRVFSADNCFLLPATPAVGDITYFGWLNLFDRLSIDMGTPATGTITGIWEGWNGASWVALNYVDDDGTALGTAKDGTSGFTASGLKIVAFDQPSNLALINGNTTDITDGSGPGDAAFPNASLYYVRFRVTAVSTPGQPNAVRVTVGKDVAVALDTSDANQGSDEKPNFISDTHVDLVTVLELLLESTLLGVVLRKDGFHAKFIDNAASPDYTYAAAHVFFSNLKRASLVIPNKVTYTNLEPLSSGTRFEGSDTDAPSIAAIGTIPIIVVDPGVIANGDVLGGGVKLAGRYLDRVTRDLVQGDILAPLSCNQEVWDMVRVEDSRTSVNYNGRVSQLRRQFTPGIYNIQVTMGGVPAAGLPQVSPTPEPTAPTVMPGLTAFPEAQRPIVERAIHTGLQARPMTEAESTLRQLLAIIEAQEKRR